MHEVLVNRLGGLSLPRKSVVRLTDRPDMTLDVYRGRKTTMQQQKNTRPRRLSDIHTHLKDVKNKKLGDYKYLSWVYDVDRKICHEGH